MAPAALAAGPDGRTPWMGAKLRGNEVVAVLRPSPAAVAGLEVRDRILSVDGATTQRGADVARAVMAGRIDHISVVRIQRGDKLMSLAVFLAARPDRDETPADAPPDDPWMGPSAAPEIQPTPPARAPSAADDDIAPVDLARYRGEVVVVEFFATWCGACRETMPTLNGWADRYGASGLRVVSVSTEDEGLLRGYRDKVGLHTVVATDPDGALSNKHGVTALPTLVVFDKAGKPRGRYVGGGRNLAQIESLFRDLMREGGGREDGPTF
jgi:thiol-disulfide isomerase/thioredoxin